VCQHHEGKSSRCCSMRSMFVSCLMSFLIHPRELPRAFAHSTWNLEIHFQKHCFIWRTKSNDNLQGAFV